MRTITKNFEEKIILTAPYERPNMQINVEKIRLIHYERANLGRSVKGMKLTAPYEYTNIRTTLRR